MSAAFTIKVGEFEGPLDLLLSLIEKRKLHISDISLAQVADDYIIYLERYQGSPVADMASFVLVASTLMLVKSLSLLPTLSLTEEEKQSVEDLERRLKLYQRARELSIHIKNRFGTAPIYFAEAKKQIQPVFSPTPEITAPAFLAAIRRLITALPKAEALPQVIVRQVMSLEEAMESLAGRIQRAIKLSFNDVVKEHRTDRVNVIVSFLSMLELVKQGIIDVTQRGHFEDIGIESRRIDTPRYD